VHASLFGDDIRPSHSDCLPFFLLLTLSTNRYTYPHSLTSHSYFHPAFTDSD
jgi:hypothetical protein